MITAEMNVLAWCRRRTKSRLPCMRGASRVDPRPGKIVDNARWDGPVIYAGASWAIVWQQLIEAGEVAP